MPYKMVRELVKRSSSIFMLITLLLMIFSKSALGVSFVIETDKESYVPNEHITISGLGNPGESVNIAVKYDDVTIFGSTVITTTEGFFTLTFLLTAIQPGEYSVTATTDLQGAETGFRILDGDSKLAQDLLELLEMSREKTQDMLELEEGDPVYVEGSHETFLMAEEVAEEAYQLNGEGRYQEAAIKITEALGLYSESIRITDESIRFAENVEEKPDEDFEKNVERILELKAALERTYAYLEKVRSASAEFEEDGFDVSQVNSKIEKALQLLRTVEEYLEEGVVDEAEVLISNVKVLLREAMELIQEINEFNKIEKARKFLTETEDRLGLMEERITGILGNIGVSEIILNEVSSVFVNAMQGIEEVKTLLETGDIEEAIEEFEGVFANAEEGLVIVDEFDGDKREILSNVEELEAKIHYLAEKIESLRDFSVDVSSFVSKYKYALSLLEVAIQKLEDGIVDVPHELIEEVENRVWALENELEYVHRKIRAEAELTDEMSSRDEGIATLHTDETSESEPGVTDWDESTVRNERSVELLMWIDMLEKELTRLAVRIDELGETGYNVNEFVTKLEIGRKMIHSAVELLDTGELDPASMWISELESHLGHVESVLNSIQGEELNKETDSTNVISEVVEECDEEAIKMYSMDLEELEVEIAQMWGLMESMEDTGNSLEPHLQYAKLLFAELAELKPCDESVTVKMSQLLDLLDEVGQFGQAIQENTDSTEVHVPEEVGVSDEEPVEEPVEGIQYYLLEMGNESYGKFEWMVVKFFEEESRIVFEEGKVYDSFLEWILSTSDEIYEPMHGRIISVNWNNEEIVDRYFEGAVPFSWRGSELDSFTGEPHLMERLELIVSFVDEA
jgi:tetratricopeptide (TPR) repeat protein